MSGQDRVDVTATAAPLAETRPSGDGAAPATIGRFEIVSKLGAGGMGVVMLATDPLLGRKVAIKIVRGERTSDAAKRRLLREAQAMAQLSHENAIVVHEVGEHAGEVSGLPDAGDRRRIQRREADEPPAVDVVGVGSRRLGTSGAAFRGR